MKKTATILLLLTGILMSFAQTHLFRIINNGKIGYMDASGKTIIEPKYHNGTDFFGDYAAVRENGLYGIINTKGEYVLKPSYDIILQGIENYTIGKNNGKSELIDITGKIVFKKDVDYCFVEPEYLFVYTIDKNVYVFDRKTGRELTDPKPIRKKPEQKHSITISKPKYSLIETKNTWIVTDSLGKQLVKLDEDVSPVNDSIQGDFLFYEKYINHQTKTGFINLKTLSKFPAKITNYYNGSFENGLLRAMVNKKLTYINENGKIIWQQSDDTTLKPLNIDYMLRGDFRAYDKTTKDYNGWATSDNLPIKNKAGAFKPNQLSVVIDTDRKNTFDKAYEGMSVYIANTTSTPFEFFASDSRLEMVIQAKDEKGKWNDILYIPRSSCGNSLHTLHLPKNEHWEFTMSIFDGSFETEIRIKLTPEFNGKQYYSNSIKAKVNPGQFFYKQSYRAQGIMDPYNE